MSKTEKENLFFEGGIAIMQGINADIKTIGDRATWLVGYLVIVVVTSASFIFGDSNTQTYQNFTTALFVMYLGNIFFILPAIIFPSLKANTYNYLEELANAKGDLGDIKKQIGEKFKKNIKQNTKMLEQLKLRFGISVFSITISFPLGLAFTAYLGF